MGRDSKNVNHRRHADITGPTAKESAEQPTDERDQQNDPKRDGDAGLWKRDHRGNPPALDFFSDVLKSRNISLGAGAAGFLGKRSFGPSKSFQALPDHEG